MTNNSQRNIDIPLNRRNRDYTLSGNIFVYSARARARERERGGTGRVNLSVT